MTDKQTAARRRCVKGKSWKFTPFSLLERWIWIFDLCIAPIFCIVNSGVFQRHRFCEEQLPNHSSDWQMWRSLYHERTLGRYASPSQFHWNQRYHKVTISPHELTCRHIYQQVHKSNLYPISVYAPTLALRHENLKYSILDLLEKS